MKQDVWTGLSAKLGSNCLESSKERGIIRNLPKPYDSISLPDVTAQSFKSLSQDDMEELTQAQAPFFNILHQYSS